MIRLHQVSKHYGPKRGGAAAVAAVRDLSLTVRRGETWAVVGPNGAGKSSLLGLILGFLRPTAGSVEIDGQEPRRYLRHHGAGYLPERFTLPGEWPVRAALLGFARLEGHGRDAARRTDEAIERFGLGEHADKPFTALSHGLRQRLGLAQATLGGRALLVLDEPTEALDPLWRIRLRDMLAPLGASGTTVLMASHDLGEVDRVAERVIVIDRGVVREVLDTRISPATQRYLLALTTPSHHVAEVFPGAEVRAAEAGAMYELEVADAHELSRGLEALLSAGVVITSAQPLAEPLEERVRRALEEPER
jgi:ABC-type multidrug transport system ATPase subunit